MRSPADRARAGASRAALGHALVEEPVSPAAGSLGRVKRHVAGPEQELGIVAVVRSERDADAGADADMLAVDFVGLRKDLQRAAWPTPPAARSSKCWGSRTANSSPPRRATRLPARSVARQSLGNRLQQGVADPVPQRVVDDLEPVEVEAEQGKALVLVVALGLCGFLPERRSSPALPGNAGGWPGQSGRPRRQAARPPPAPAGSE